MFFFSFQFIAGPGIEEDVNLMPVKLPLEIHDDIKPLDTKVKVKEEPMDVDGKVGAETLDQKPEKEANKMNMTRVSQPEPISCSDLFLGQKKYGKLFAKYRHISFLCEQ